MIQGKAQIGEATGGSLGGAALAHWEVREKGPWGQDQGASLVRAAAAPVPLVASLVGTLGV